MRTAVFYILSFAEMNQVLLFTCHLVDKLFNTSDKESVYIQTDSLAAAQQLDNLLWTFKEISFLPHTLANENIAVPILIGHDMHPATDKTLINLSMQANEINNQYAKVYEIVSSQPDIQAMARERYKSYRDQDFQLATHKISSPTGTFSS